MSPSGMLPQAGRSSGALTRLLRRTEGKEEAAESPRKWYEVARKAMGKNRRKKLIR